MLKFSDLLQFPSFYRGRYGSDRTVALDKIDATEKENEDGTKSFIFTCISNKKYETVIEIIKSGNERSLNQCKIKAYCGCDSFKYEFANLFKKNLSLFKPVIYPQKIYIRNNAKKRNKYEVISPCKHLVRFANYLTTKMK